MSNSSNTLFIRFLCRDKAVRRRRREGGRDSDLKEKL
jgi:hypothetical protein